VANPAVSSTGEQVGGVVGFLYSMTGMIETYNPRKTIVVWESGGSARKRSIYSEYKKKRRPAKLNRFYNDELPDTVQNRNGQVSLIIELLNNSPVCQLYVPDCEADDVIGYICKYTYSDSKKLIISSDKDFYQLLDKNTIIFSPTWKKLVTSKEVREKFKIAPQNFCLAKSICGDPADNIGGVKGVGFKTLAKRFPSLGECEDIMIRDIIDYARDMVNSGSKVKAYLNIIESESVIIRNWKLILLDTANLSGTQIKKINDGIDMFEPVRDKIKTMRILIREGVQTFNVDRMFLACKNMEKM
tara:strand:- start:3980 stop:4882 length:903 start_codon:yes stop_codon:yes gene_type:complete